MNSLQTVLLVVQLIIAVSLVVVILFQRTAQDGGGLVGGGSTMGGLFTARGSANVLTRMTSILATLFILNSLGLGYIASSQHKNHSIVDQLPSTTPITAPGVPETPTVPSMPKSGPVSELPIPTLPTPPAAGQPTPLVPTPAAPVPQAPIPATGEEQKPATPQPNAPPQVPLGQ